MIEDGAWIAVYVNRRRTPLFAAIRAEAKAEALEIADEYFRSFTSYREGGTIFVQREEDTALVQRDFDDGQISWSLPDAHNKK